MKPMQKNSFNQHFLNTLEVSIFLIIGLAAVIFEIISNKATDCISGEIFLEFGIAFLIFIQNKYMRNLQKYKKLFTDIIDL
jgi:hypothetical protein